MAKYLFGMTGHRSERVVVAPSLGLDFGVVDLGESAGSPSYLIVSSDPVTGVSQRAGWYAVNVSANDVATSGNRPQFMQSVILLPEMAAAEDVKEIASEMHETARSLGIAIVGGHTELTPGLRRPIVATTAFSVAYSYVTAAGAHEGDTLMMTKTAGVEGTAILGTDPRFAGRLGKGAKAGAKRLFKELSVVAEAAAAYSTGAVHAMHDCTEGGVLGAIFEMAAASGKGLEVGEAEIPVARETRRVCDVLGVDPLKLISSGTLLLAVERGREGEVSAQLRRSGSGATTIGRFGGGKVVLETKGRRVEVSGPPEDEIWRLHERARP